MNSKCLFGQTNSIFRFASKTWKKVGAGGYNKNKNIINFYKLKVFQWFLWWYTNMFNLSEPLVCAGSWYAMCFTSIRVCFPGTMMSTSS